MSLQPAPAGSRYELLACIGAGDRYPRRMALDFTAAEELRDLPVDPIFFGIGTFVLLMLLMVGLLIFGKGRSHS